MSGEQRGLFSSFPGKPGKEPNLAARDEGIARVCVSQAVFIRRCVEWIRSLDEGVFFSADDLAEWAVEEGIGCDQPNAFGAVFRVAQAQGHVQGTGRYQKSRQASRRGGVIQVWRRR